MITPRPGLWTRLVHPDSRQRNLGVANTGHRPREGVERLPSDAAGAAMEFARWRRAGGGGGRKGAIRICQRAHHYLGALPKIGETLWYAARWRGAWVALIGFSAPALKCGTFATAGSAGTSARSTTCQHLMPTTACVLILPDRRAAETGLAGLACCATAARAGLPARFGHPIVRWRRSSTWRAFAARSTAPRTSRPASRRAASGRGGGYSAAPAAPKLVLRPPPGCRRAARLTRPALHP